MIARLIMGLGLTAVMSFSAFAEQAAAVAGKDETTASTQRWLDLQRSGKAASPNPQTLSGEALHQIHQRYLKNFTHEIPDHYEYEEKSTQ